MEHKEPVRQNLEIVEHVEPQVERRFVDELIIAFKNYRRLHYPKRRNLQGISHVPLEQIADIQVWFGVEITSPADEEEN